MEAIPRELIEQAQAGDIEAFEKIYRAASGLVYSVALRVTGNRQEAEEITQDVFVKIYRSIRDFRFESSFKTWAYRIAMNTALNAYKRMARDMHRREDFDTVIETRAADTDTVKELVGQEERQQRETLLESLLTLLNPDQRACIVLREIEGLSYEEIAQVLRVNINTVRSRLKRARETLLAHTGTLT